MEAVHLLWLGAGISGLLFVAGAAARIRIWTQGRSGSPVRLADFLQAPRRYLVDLHHVVSRDRFSARAHIAVGLGFLATCVLLALRFCVKSPPALLDIIFAVALATLIGGAIAFGVRRSRSARARAGRLSGGAWGRLWIWMSLFAAGLGLVILTPRLTNHHAGEFLGAAIASVALVVVVGAAGWGGPMRHAFAGIVNLAIHARPKRFGGGRSVDLRPISGDADYSGVRAPRDFRWDQIVSFDACVQCGRCEAACPALDAAQPLNPKKLIFDLMTGVSGPRDDGDYRGRGHPGIPIGSRHGAPDAPIISDLISPETLWACTTCRACVEECPMMIEHVDAVIDMRRYLVSEHGAVAESGARVLENLRLTDTRCGRALGARFDWAADLDLPRAASGSPFDVLLWVGEAGFELRGQRTLRALVKIFRQTNVDFAVLGDEERDIGDLARRLGDEETFMALFQQNKAALDRYQFRLIVSADPHVVQCLSEEYSALGGRYQILHHSQFLAQLAKAGHLSHTQAAATEVTFHDPCYLGRYMGEFDAPRKVLEAAGARIVEMDRGRSRSRCCGGGGGASLIDVPGEQRIADMRLEDAAATGAGILAVACPQCALMFEGANGPKPIIKDIAEILCDAMSPT